MVRKAQAAMEFLMTYGWAILVVLAAIGALAYFGVLDPGKLLPERCQFPAGTDCTDKASIGGSDPNQYVTLAFKNSLGHAVTIEQTQALVKLSKDCSAAQAAEGAWINYITVTPEGGVCTYYGADPGNGCVVSAPVVTNAPVNNGDAYTINFKCAYGTSKKVSPTITYYVVNPDNSLAQKVVGDIRARAQ
jgi:hypothetical protein